jgi:hypothetical protein
MDDLAWDSFVQSSSAGTIFHSSIWQRHSPHKFLRVAVSSACDMLCGALLQIDTDHRGTLGSFAPYLGPILARQCSSLSTNSCRRALTLLAREIKNYVSEPKFISSPWLDTLEPFIVQGYTAKLLYTRVLKWENYHALWSEFSSSLRSNIRAAEKLGLSVLASADSADMMTLVQKTFQRQGVTPWFSCEEVEACWRALALAGQAMNFIVRDQSGAIVAGVGIAWDRRRAYYSLGGYDVAHSHRGAGSLAMWVAIKFVSDHLGLQEFDLEGSHLPAISHFFRKFGGILRPFYVVEFNAEGVFGSQIG